MTPFSLPNPWTQPLVLPTEREGLELIQLTIEDAPYFFNSWLHSAEEIAEFDPDTIGKFDSIEEVEASMYETGRLRMGAWDGGKFVGSGSLRPDKEPGVWLLSYWTDSRETGNGYGYLTAKALATYAVGRFPIVRAEAMEQNVHSINILEKLKSERTGSNVGKFALFELVQ